MRTLLIGFLLSGAICHGAEQGSVRHIVVPGYPSLALQAQLQGTVSVQVEIGADGKVLSAKGSGAHTLLVRAAEENARQWTYDAIGTEGNSARKQTVVYVYKLAGKEKYYERCPVVIIDLPSRVEITGHPPEAQP